VEVTINDEVQGWCDTHKASKALQTKCTEAYNDNFSTWRHVGKSVYDFRASGDYRVVARKSTAAFAVKAVYQHATRGGKVHVCGEKVKDYGD